MARARVRRIGNSLGVIVPTDEARRLGLRDGDEVDIELRKTLTLAQVRGVLKGKLGSIDELNKLVDEGEDVG